MSRKTLAVRNVFTPTALNATIASTQYKVIDLNNCIGFSVQHNYLDAAPSAVTFDSNTYEVQTLTFDTKANTTHQDLIIVYDAAGLSYAVALTKPVAEVQTVTFPAVAASTGGDYFVVEDTTGTKWAAALNKSGADPEPTGAIWTAIAAGNKVNVDISGGTDAASVAALVETAMDALTGFTAVITTDDTAADGTMLFTNVVKAPVTNPVVKNADDSGAGSITGVQTTGGVASTAPSGALWTAVNASRKGLADISGDTTAAQVAARAETALNALTGFTAAITTDDTAADGTMTLTQTAFGPVTNPVPKNAAESAAGSIAGVQTTGGLTTEINLTANTMSIPAHGLVTGTKVAATTAITLPTGLSATNYWVIKVDADTIKLASSLANAEAGTAVDLTGEGSGQHTLTPATASTNVFKLQKSNDGTNWVDISSMTVTNATSTVSTFMEVSNPTYRYLKALYTPTAGQATVSTYIVLVV
jgi:hypothetical protein